MPARKLASGGDIAFADGPQQRTMLGYSGSTPTSLISLVSRFSSASIIVAVSAGEEFLVLADAR